MEASPSSIGTEAFQHPRADLRPPVLLFFALTYALSWIAFSTLALAQQPAFSFPWILPYLVGGSGPSLVAVLLVCRTRSAEAPRGFWARVVDPRRISTAWWAVVLLLFPILELLSTCILWVAGRPIPPLDRAVETLTNPVSFVVFSLTVLIGGGLSEELGWRGYAQPRLQAQYGVIAASLLIGAVWWAWHLPTFFISGTAQHGFGIATPLFWLFIMRTLGASVLLGWIYAATRGSILAVIVMHGSYNASLSLLAGVGQAQQVEPFLVSTALIALVAMLIAFRKGHRVGLRSGVSR